MSESQDAAPPPPPPPVEPPPDSSWVNFEEIQRVEVIRDVETRANE